MKDSTVTISDKPRTVNEFDRWVGSRVREAREALGYSQQSLASNLYVTFQQIQKNEKGVNRISVGRLCVIARTLRLPVCQLLPPEDETDYTPPILSGLELELLKRFRKLPKEQQSTIYNILEGFQKTA